MIIHLRKLSAIYAIIIGLIMMGMWSVFVFTNQIPELNTGSIEIIYHLIAEFLTAILLIVSGIGLVKRKNWSLHLLLVSLGMLFYTTIVSAGYYADTGDLSMVIMFSILQLITLLFILMNIIKRNHFEEN